MNYLTASFKLTGRCKDARKLGNNTWLERRGPDIIAVRLHGTDVVTFHADGRIVLNSGHWRTPTTKARLNEYAPIRIYQKDFDWFIAGPDWKPTHRFQDGLTIHPDGNISGATLITN